VKPRASSRRNIVRGLGLAWHASPKYFLLAATIAVLNAALPPLEIWLTKHLVDLSVTGEANATFGVVPTVVGLGALFGTDFVLGALRMNMQDLFARQVERHAMRSFLHKAATVDIGHFDDAKFHDAAARARRDVLWVPGHMTFMTVELFGTVLGIVGMLGLLLAMSPTVAGLLLISAVTWVALQRKVTGQLFEFRVSNTPADRERNYMGDLLAEPPTAKEVRSFGLVDHLLDRYTRLTDANTKKLMQLYRRALAVTIGLAVLSAAIIAGAYWLLADPASVRAFTPGDLVAAFGAFAATARYAHMMSHQIGQLERQATFIDDFFTFLDVPPLVPVREAPRRLPAPLPAGVTVEGVRFTYPNGKQEALAGLDLEVKPGELVAIVGENGAGKTTIVNLLSRFYDPAAGRITFGGIDVRELDPIELRSRIGVLLQDFAKYQLTLRENVAFGRVDRAAEDAAILTSLDAARAKFLMTSLGKGLDAQLGRLFDGGQELSGGEWQRLAIARLMFRSADLWILDEPTSNLDPEAEAGIFAELKQQLAGRMAIVISHRFSTVRVADRIYVIADGRVLESGSHATLLAAKGRYAELFELQAAGYR
jgi:ATP-binding cassette subfamily B protein